MYAYQSGVDGQLFVWIDQQKDVSNVSLQKRRKADLLLMNQIMQNIYL